jgi:hypothetical protein
VLSNNSIFQKIFFGLTILTFGAFHSYFFFLFNRLFLTSFESVQSSSSSSSTRLLQQQTPTLGFSNTSESQFLITQKNDKFGQKTKINQIFYFNLMNASMIDSSNSLRGGSFLFYLVTFF